MELDPRTIKFKARFADAIVEFLESEYSKGEICKQELSNWYAVFAKYLPDLRTKPITKEQRRMEAEVSRGQRLNGHQIKPSLLNKLKESTLCTKA